MIKIFNPTQIIEDIFNRLYPNTECEVKFISGLYKEHNTYGRAIFLEDSKHIIEIEVESTLSVYIETMIHTLARVVVGPDASNDSTEFTEVADAITTEYINKVYKIEEVISDEVDIGYLH